MDSPDQLRLPLIDEGPAAGSLHLRDLVLVRTSASGTVLATGVGLVADSTGLAVVDATERAAKHWPWVAVMRVARAGPLPDPDGILQPTLEVDLGGRRLRFLCPGTDLERLLDLTRHHMAEDPQLVIAGDERFTVARSRWCAEPPVIAPAPTHGPAPTDPSAEYPALADEAAPPEAAPAPIPAVPRTARRAGRRRRAPAHAAKTDSGALHGTRSLAGALIGALVTPLLHAAFPRMGRHAARPRHPSSVNRGRLRFIPWPGTGRGSDTRRDLGTGREREATLETDTTPERPDGPLHSRESALLTGFRTGFPRIAAFARGRTTVAGLPWEVPLEPRSLQVARWLRSGGWPRMTGAAALSGALVAIVGILAVDLGGGGLSAGAQANATRHGIHLQHPEAPLASRLGSASALNLPAATSAPLPAPPSLAGAPPLAPHEVVGFAPYWTLPEAGGFDVANLSTVVYFSLDVNADATLVESGPGWVGFESQDLVNLVTRAHQAGDRVVLTVTCFDQGNLDQLASALDAGTKLGNELIPLLRAKNLDGVNVDFEGTGAADRLGLDRLVGQLSTVVHGADTHWQLTMDTYASSAGDPAGFFDIAGLTPNVDAFFVMAYDMENPQGPSANSPLSGTSFDDQQAVSEYSAVATPQKVVLGLPWYGYDWPTAGPGLGDPATGPPTPVPYSATAGHPVYWDPSTQTAWTSYQSGTQWHQTWFDNATSLALKAAMATNAGLRGVGIWALGMDGGDGSLLSALLGHSPVVRDLNPGPGPSATTTIANGSTTTTSIGYRGFFDGSSVTLLLVNPQGDPGPTGPQVGRLDNFASNDPAFGCLVGTGAELTVYQITDSSLLLAVATTPTDCVSGRWVFNPASATVTTTTTIAGPTTTTSSSTSTLPTTTSTSTTTVTPTTGVSPPTTAASSH